MPGGSAANNKAANKDEDLLSPDIVDIKTMLNESQSKQQQETGAKKQSPSPPKLSVNSSRKSMRKSLDKELDKFVIAGWGLEEKEISDNLKHYFEHLPGPLKHSFAPINVLFDQLMSCYDPHLLVYKTVKAPSMSGLIAFNVDTMVQK